MRRPVISVGNLAMGGRGKTPAVAHIAQMLVDAGERPAILSRGYGRRRPDDGVVVVSDSRHLRADLDRSGDEPLMLARRVPGAAVLVCDVRATAAAVAETVLGVSVHLLDDGFQHWSIARDIDVVLVSPSDVDDRRLPFGRLRSPLTALAGVDAVVVDGDVEAVRARLGRFLSPSTTVFGLVRHVRAPVWIDERESLRPPPDRRHPVVAVAGIADPQRFVRSLEADGWTVDEMLGFADHHHYRGRDLSRIAAVAAGRTVLVTEKDAVRLLPFRPLPFRAAAVPLDVRIEPDRAFRPWLLTRLESVRR